MCLHYDGYHYFMCLSFMDAHIIILAPIMHDMCNQAYFTEFVKIWNPQKFPAIQ